MRSGGLSSARSSDTLGTVRFKYPLKPRAHHWQARWFA